MISAQLAEQLRRAESSRMPVESIAGRHPELSMADALVIQDINVRRRVACGERVIGHCLIPEGSDGPDIATAVFTDRMEIGGSVIDVLPQMPLALRCGVGVVLATSIDRNTGLAEIGQSIARVMLVGETLNSRIERGAECDIDLVSDNGGLVGLVRGPDVEATPELLDALSSDVRVRTEGAGGPLGAAVIHQPLEQIARLAATLAERGTILRPGDLVVVTGRDKGIALSPKSAFTVTSAVLPPLVITSH